MQGEMDFKTAIQERVKLLEGVSVDEIKKICDEIPLMDGAEETIKTLKDKGYKLAIISGSFDIIADSIKEQLGMDFAFSNTLINEDGKLTGEVTGPLVEGNKADVLKDLVEEEGISLEECAAIGDGANDISMIEAVSLGIAFNAKPALKEIAKENVEGKDLSKILPLFEDSDDEAEKVEEAEVEPIEEAEKVEEAEVEPVEEEKEPTEAELAIAEIEENCTSVIDKKNELERLLSSISDEREKYNQDAKKYREERDKLNNSLKENLNQAIDYRDKRNKINEEVEQNKKLRDKTNEELKKMEWSSGRRDRIKIENEIKKIDKIIETRVLDIKKENKLVKDANDLRKKLMAIEEDESVQAEAQKLKAISEEHHHKVVELSEQAQEYHEKMLEYFRNTDEIRSKADEAHKNFLSSKNNASAKHEDFKTVLGEIHKVNKELGGMRSKKRESENKSSKKKDAEEKEKAEEIFRRFKEGEKVSTEDILLLQKHHIV